MAVVSAARPVPPGGSSFHQARRWLGRASFVVGVGLVLGTGWDAASFMWGVGVNLVVFSVPCLTVLGLATLADLSRIEGFNPLVFLGAIFLGAFIVLAWPLMTLLGLQETYPLDQVVPFDAARPWWTLKQLFSSFLPYTTAFLLSDAYDVLRLTLKEKARTGPISTFGAAMFIQSSAGALVLLWGLGALPEDPGATGVKVALLAEMVSYLLLGPVLLKLAARQDRLRPTGRGTGGAER